MCRDGNFHIWRQCLLWKDKTLPLLKWKHPDVTLKELIHRLGEDLVVGICVGFAAESLVL